MKIACEACRFSEVLAVEGENYSYLNPFGNEVHKIYPETVLICRAAPPIAGDWPKVSPEDWCGYFKSRLN